MDGWIDIDRWMTDGERERKDRRKEGSSCLWMPYSIPFEYQHSTIKETDLLQTVSLSTLSFL